MRRLDARLRLGALMGTVAVGAVSLAAIRVDSAPVAGMAIIGSCVVLLASRRYSEVAALRDATGSRPGPWTRGRQLLGAATIASIVIGISDLAFLVGYHGFLKVADETNRMNHWTPYYDPIYMATGALIGTGLAVWVGSCLRQFFWTGPTSPRRWRVLWPVALVAIHALALGMEEMRQRWEFCTMMAAYHAGPEAQKDGPEKAALHNWLSRWYEKAALRPWLPIHPDRIPPEL